MGPKGLEKLSYPLFSQVQGTPREVDSACSSHAADSEVNFPWCCLPPRPALLSHSSLITSAFTTPSQSPWNTSASYSTYCKIRVQRRNSKT